MLKRTGLSQWTNAYKPVFVLHKRLVCSGSQALNVCPELIEHIPAHPMTTLPPPPHTHLTYVYYKTIPALSSSVFLFSVSRESLPCESPILLSHIQVRKNVH